MPNLVVTMSALACTTCMRTYSVRTNLFYILIISGPRHDSGEASQPVLTFLSNPRVIITLLTATMGAYSIGTVESTLFSFLEHMGLVVKLIAIVFLVMSFCSVVATPFFSWMSNGKISPLAAVSSLNCNL